jgi:hypothetical protein
MWWHSLNPQWLGIQLLQKEDTATLGWTQLLFFTCHTVFTLLFFNAMKRIVQNNKILTQTQLPDASLRSFTILSAETAVLSTELPNGTALFSAGSQDHEGDGQLVGRWIRKQHLERGLLVQTSFWYLMPPSDSSSVPSTHIGKHFKVHIVPLDKPSNRENGSLGFAIKLNKYLYKMGLVHWHSNGNVLTVKFALPTIPPGFLVW